MRPTHNLSFFVCQVADINASRPSPRRRFIAEKNILRVMTRLRRGGCIKGREVDRSINRASPRSVTSPIDSSMYIGPQYRLCTWEPALIVCGRVEGTLNLPNN